MVTEGSCVEVDDAAAQFLVRVPDAAAVPHSNGDAETGQIETEASTGQEFISRGGVCCIDVVGHEVARTHPVEPLQGYDPAVAGGPPQRQTQPHSTRNRICAAAQLTLGKVP